jgi:hypothetical protein
MTGTSGSFLSVRPEWTLAGAIVSFTYGPNQTVEQSAFRLVDGFWEAEAVLRCDDADDRPATRVVLRVTPDTLRRWKEVGINPFLEACAQLQEHLRFHTRHNHLTALTLL